MPNRDQLDARAEQARRVWDKDLPWDNIPRQAEKGHKAVRPLRRAAERAALNEVLADEKEG